MKLVLLLFAVLTGANAGFLLQPTTTRTEVWNSSDCGCEMTTIQVNQQCFCDREAERLSVCLAEKRGPQPTRRECGSPIDNPNFGECIRNSVDRRISYHQECIEEENIQSSPRRPSEARGLASSDDIIDKTTIVAASSGSKFLNFQVFLVVSAILVFLF